MLRRFKLLALILLALCMAFSALGEEVTAETEAEMEAVSAIPAEYSKVAENSRFNLYLREANLSIIVESKASGKLLHSTVQSLDGLKDNESWQGFYQSGVVMEYIEDVKSTNTQADFINMASEIVYDYADNGFTAHVKFPDVGISFDLVLVMDETGFAVTIPQDEIVEEMSDKYTVATFTVFPFLGYSYLGQDEGYMIIPDGQGAIIELKDNEKRYSSPYDRPVYGTNIGIEDTVNSMWSVSTEPVIMPVLGMVHTEDQIGFLSVIEEGDQAARIMAYPNGVRTSFDWVAARYTYRMVYAQPTGPSSGTVSMRTEKARDFDIVQRFFLEDGESATYAGLASAWRNYMVEKGTFQHADDRPFDVQIDFIGLEKENYVLGKQDVVMTSFQQAEDMVSELYNSGVESMAIVYRGWQAEGLTGSLPTDGYTPAAALGGKAGFESLKALAEEKGLHLALEADFLTLNPSVNPVMSYNALKKITSQTFSKPSFGLVYDTLNYLTPSKTLEIGQSAIADMKNGGVPGISLTGVTQLMTDYYYKNAYHDSTELQETYRALAQTAVETMPTTLAAANAYLWPYADALSDMPVAGSDYTYTAREVPLLAIATSGQIPYYAEYVNFQANNKEFFLNMLEQGARPCFLLTWEDPIELQNTNSSGIYSSRYDLYRDTIVEWYKALNEFQQQVEGASIIRHDVEGNMTRVTWTNGVTVYLNFGDKQASMDGVTLDSMAYKVVK